MAAKVKKNSELQTGQNKKKTNLPGNTIIVFGEFFFPIHPPLVHINMETCSMGKTGERLGDCLQRTNNAL